MTKAGNQRVMIKAGSQRAMTNAGSQRAMIKAGNHKIITRIMTKAINPGPFNSLDNYFERKSPFLYLFVSRLHLFQSLYC